MKNIVFALGAMALVSSGATAHAADAAAGKAKAQDCAACHGANGISVSADIPNLAGQKEKYVAGQLKAFKSGARKNAMMNAVAEQLSDDDIANLAAFWNGLPPGGGKDASDMLAAINKTSVTFPADYKKTFKMYTKVNRPKKNQVRYLFANEAAMKAVKEGKQMGDGAYILVEAYKAKLDGDGKPVTGSDGFYERASEEPAFYTAMAVGKGWGNDIPDLYRNGDWNYAVFKGDKSLKPGVNQAKCFACHKPLDKDSYVFTLEKLASAIK